MIKEEPVDKNAHTWKSLKLTALEDCRHCLKTIIPSTGFKCAACSYTIHRECLAKLGKSTLFCAKQSPGSTSVGSPGQRDSKDSARAVSPPPGTPTLTPSASTAKLTKEHKFSVVNLTRPTYCTHCKDFIWGIANQGFKCKECNMVIHKKCLIKVPDNCVKAEHLLKEVEELQEKLRKLEASQKGEGSPSSPPKSPPQSQSPPATSPPPELARAGSQTSNKSDPDEEREMCVICMEQRISTVFLECGHRCCCLKCAQAPAAPATHRCPICMQAIVRVVRIYDAH